MVLWVSTIALISLAACGNAAAASPSSLPRNTVVSVSVVTQHFPNVTKEASTGPNETSVGKPLASRSVVFSSADGKKKVTVSVDQYASASDAAAAYQTAVQGSKAAPGFKPAATPKLGPIYQPITNMVGMAFPVLVIVPAIGVDLVMQRLRLRPLLLAPILSAVFFSLFIAVQWPFASFLMTESARNWFFNADNFVYWMSPTGVAWSRKFQETDNLTPQLLNALFTGALSAYIGLWFGTWMTKVRR